MLRHTPNCAQGPGQISWSVNLTGIAAECAISEALGPSAEAFSNVFSKTLPNFSHHEGQAIWLLSYEERVNKYFHT